MNLNHCVPNGKRAVAHKFLLLRSLTLRSLDKHVVSLPLNGVGLPRAIDLLVNFRQSRLCSWFFRPVPTGYLSVFENALGSRVASYSHVMSTTCRSVDEQGKETT